MSLYHRRSPTRADDPARRPPGGPVPGRKPRRPPRPRHPVATGALPRPPGRLVRREPDALGGRDVADDHPSGQGRVPVPRASIAGMDDGRHARTAALKPMAGSVILACEMIEDEVTLALARVGAGDAPRDDPRLRPLVWICLLYTSPSPRDRTR